MAVNAFLHDRLSFPGIYELITEALVNIPYIATPTLDDYVATHHATIRWATEAIGK